MASRITAIGRNTTVPGFRRNDSVNVRDDQGTELDAIAESAVDALVEEAANDTEGKSAKSGTLAALLDTGDLMCDAADALIDDSFFRCFTSAPPDPWNFTWWLFPQWCLGVVLRFGILFPIRLALTLLGMLVFLTIFFSDTPRRRSAEREIVRWIACLWVALAWNGVIKYHGPKPSPAPNRVWVANHSSMIDYTILAAFMPFANIMQLQGSWVGFLQKRVMSCVGCVWFQRGEAKDRNLVHRRMLEHVQDPHTTPLLVFPEGTCVNNEYTVMFKKGAFDLGATVCPIAIKYNKIFVDAFWNSRRQAFSTYIFKLMTSWALVADVYFLPPQRIQEGESAEQFAARVQRMIADAAKLRIVTWDGYLKYYSLAEKKPQLVEARRRAIAKRLLHEVGESAETLNGNAASEDESE